MLQGESEYVARVLLGKENLIRGNGSLNMTAAMYIMLLAADAKFEQEVRQIVVEHFDRRLRKCMRAMTSPLIDMLRNKKVVHAISNYMHFIAVSCPARGIPIEEFTSMEELRRLWREVHLRSARANAGSIANAVLAGITPEEIGISQAVADEAVDRYFGRNNPKRITDWEQHEAEYKEMKKLFAA